METRLQDQMHWLFHKQPEESWHGPFVRLPGNALLSIFGTPRRFKPVCLSKVFQLTLFSGYFVHSQGRLTLFTLSFELQTPQNQSSSFLT